MRIGGTDREMTGPLFAS